MNDLFDERVVKDITVHAPLADRIRPRSFDELVGQEHIIGKGKLLRRAMENDELFSVIFWGPPGTGKTTVARLISSLTQSHFTPLSAVTSGLPDLRAVIAAAMDRRKYTQQRTILFVDEIHRWNKAQQDALLPHVENGTVTLIGATTENPSFEVISPLLSRVKVFVLNALGPAELGTIVRQALTDTERGLGDMHVVLTKHALALLLEGSNGDARSALNALEIAVKATRPGKDGKRHVSLEAVEEAMQSRRLRYDKGGEEHFNVISAFIKSMRGSNPDATVYWLARMIEAGEDPLFIARRMVVFASEDISLADPNALPLAVATFQACEKVGLPECRITLSHCAIALALAPKNNTTYTALEEAMGDVKQTLNEPVPLNLRNAPTKLMKDLGYHKGYKYAHDYEEGDPDAGQDYLPPSLKDKKYFHTKT